MTYYKIADIIDDRYKVLDILGGPGKSGQGIVYVCADEKNNNEIVAIKTLQDQFLTDERMMNSLKREALAWVQLENYPFIVKALFVKNINEIPFIGLEYIAKDKKSRNTLTDFLKTPITIDQALIWSIQFCYGMEYANSKGIATHRDIKPANIMITVDGTVKITDFTLVQFIGEKNQTQDWKRLDQVNEQLKQTFLRLHEGCISGGTVPWMAPEQFDNVSTIQSDIYSFGVVLYQLFNAGMLPFECKTAAEYYYAHKMKTAAPLTSKLNPIVKKCLEKKPDDRYKSFSELRKDLEKAYFAETNKAPPTVPRENESSARDYNNRGVSYANLGFPNEAINEFKKALVRDPSFTHAQVNLAHLYKKRKEYDKAEKILLNALKTTINIFSIHRLLGKIYEGKKEYEKALEEYRSVIRIEPRFHKAHYDVARISDVLENYDDAISYYETYVNFSDPSDKRIKEVKTKIHELKKKKKHL